MTQKSLDEIEERAQRLGNEEILKLATQMRNLEARMKSPLHMSKELPPIGTDIYVQGALYIDHGEDDICGGRAEVKKVTKDGFVTTVELPNRSYNWASLKEQQETLRKEYGNRRAHPCPDV